MSIAFQRSYPAIDGNARRVLDRLFTPKNDRELRQAAAWLVPRVTSRLFQSGFDGARRNDLYPKDPRCPRCPLAAHCATRAMGRRAENVRTKKSALIQDIEWPLAILRRDRKILLRQRIGATDCWRVYGSFPAAERTAGKSLRQSLAIQLAELSRTLQPRQSHR